MIKFHNDELLKIDRFYYCKILFPSIYLFYCFYFFLFRREYASIVYNCVYCDITRDKHFTKKASALFRSKQQQSYVFINVIIRYDRDYW